MFTGIVRNTHGKLNISKMTNMKNIHLLPTNKPSKLYKTGSFLLLDSRAMPNNTLETKNQHIYITSDEEIKEGEYGIDIRDSKVFKCERTLSNHYEFGVLQFQKSYCKKIILTTDQDLIKDGVQAIDDEFLEWFVKNPSCEEVEVVDNLKYFNVDELRERHLKGLPHLYSEKIGYKIIIPKEEPKQDYSGVHLRHCYQGEYEDGCKYGEDNCPAKPLEEPKQETLEEAAETNSEKHHYAFGQQSEFYQLGFIEGAKWMQERMYSKYSKEDLISFAHFYFKEEFNSTTQTSKSTDEIFKEWFEQNKKNVS